MYTGRGGPPSGAPPSDRAGFQMLDFFLTFDDTSA